MHFHCPWTLKNLVDPLGAVEFCRPRPTLEANYQLSTSLLPAPHWGVTTIVTEYSTAFELIAFAQRALASQNTSFIVSHVAVIVINKIGFLMDILRGRPNR